MWTSNDWKDYELIDAASGQRLERWGGELFVRPDPTCIWENDTSWENVAARYHRSDKGGGNWEFYKKLPPEWTLSYKDMTFKVKPMGFKHMAVFPEQAVNWDWMGELIQGAEREIRVLNLFAYTGCASVAAAKAGAHVCHVDASKGMVQMAKENADLSGVSRDKIRYIVDDCKKFVTREVNRGKRYEGIILDPPSYGRGPGGEVWKIEDELWGLLQLCKKVLSDKPLFVLLNSYTTGLSVGAVENLMKLVFGNRVTADEIGLPITRNGLNLPCGASGRWIND